MINYEVVVPIRGWRIEKLLGCYSIVCDNGRQILCAFNSSNYSGRHEQWHDKEFMRSPICGVGGSRGKGGKKGVADVGYKNCS